MRAFYLAYGESLDPTRQMDSLHFFNLPWWQNIILLTKLKENTQWLWYAQQTLECSWSQNILENWIKSDLYSRQGVDPTFVSPAATWINEAEFGHSYRDQTDHMGSHVPKLVELMPPSPWLSTDPSNEVLQSFVARSMY